MKKLNIYMVIILAFTLILVGCSEGKDLSSDEVIKDKEVVEEGKRVIAGTKTSAELLDVLDIDAIGVISSKKNLPKRFEKVEKIGEPMNPDLKLISSLEADIFITDFNLKEQIDKLLKDTDIEIIYLKNNSYDYIFSNIEKLGKVFGKEDKAKEIVDEMKEEEKEILSNEKHEDIRVLAIFGTPESFMIATKNSYVGSVVEKIGAINLGDEMAGGKPMPYIPMSLEMIADINPDKILRMSHVNPDMSKKMFEEEFNKDFWQNLDAVKNDEVYDLDSENFGVTANINVIEALREMKDIVQK